MRSRCSCAGYTGLVPRESRVMKKEARLLRDKALCSLILAVEIFNRPWDRGRSEAVLIMLDHSFEMLLKAAILHRGGQIRERRAHQTIGFDACVRRGLTDGKIKFLTDNQAITLQTINGLRDAAQHHLLDSCEEILYLHAQTGLSLFRDIHINVFNADPATELPDRVLPLSTVPITDVATFFDREIDHIRGMLKPRSRKRLEALTKIRTLAIIDSALTGQPTQPSEGDLRKLGRQLQKPGDWGQVFSGVAAINLTATGSGPSLDLRISKKEGIPIQLVPEGTPGAQTVAVRRVDELSFYNLSLTELAKKCGITSSQATAVIRHLDMCGDSDCFKEFIIGKQRYKRYSQKAIQQLKDALPDLDIAAITHEYWSRSGKTSQKQVRP